MSRSFKHLAWFVPVVAALVLLVLGKSFSYKFEDFKLSGPNNRQQPIAMPFLMGSWSLGNYTLRGNLIRSWFTPTSYRIIPDDYLHALYVNGKEIDLSGVPDDLRKDVTNGFKIDLEEFLVVGNNQLEFVFEDYGGDIGMSMQADKTDWRFGLLLYGWVAIGVWVFVIAAARAGVSRVHTALYFLILLGSIVKVWYIFTYNPVDHIWSDPARHWEQGTDLLRTDLMALTDPIGYQVYVAVIAKITLKIPELVAFYASLLALFGAWIWYRFLRELQSNKTLALCAWAFFSLLPSWTSIYAYFMQETLFVPLLGAALWSTWRCRRKAELRSFGLMIFIWILAGLTRGIAIPIAALVCTWLWLVQDQKIEKAAWSLLILVAIMGPLTYRSYELVGHFAPHGMGHLNVIYAQSGKKEIEVKSRNSTGSWGHGFGSPSMGAKPFEPFSDWQSQRKGRVRVSVDLEQGMRDWKKGMDRQKMDLKKYLWITKENFIFLFFSSSWPDNNASRLIDNLNIGMRFLWAPLFLVLIIGLAIHFRKFKGQWMFPAVLGVWFLVQCLIPISVNEGRYRKPFEGMAIAQLVLWIAVVRGQTRPAAPGTPLTEYWHCSLAYLQRKREQLSKRDQNDEPEQDADSAPEQEHTIPKAGP